MRFTNKVSHVARLQPSGLLIFLALLSITARADTLEGRVTGISDGDTLVLSDRALQQHTIHLFGTDAPELTQDFGQKARTSLSALALNQTATARCSERDRYGHELCVVFVRGKDIGLEQIRTGMAWWNQGHVLRQTTQDRSAYQHAEFNAKIRRMGLWNSKNPTPPWNWQHGRLEE